MDLVKTQVAEKKSRSKFRLNAENSRQGTDLFAKIEILAVSGDFIAVPYKYSNY